MPWGFDGRDPPAARRRRQLLERGGAVQHLADASGAVREEGRRCRQRHAARILHHHRHRRHRHGPSGHEVVAGVARGDRRLRRADDARPLLRRAGRACRLRQVAARHDDGDGAPQRAVNFHLWRINPARQFSRPPGHRAGRVRGGRPAFRRRDRTTPSCSTRSSRSACPSAGLVRRASSPPTPWRRSPRRSAWRCPIRAARRRPTRCATDSISPPARR